MNGVVASESTVSMWLKPNNADFDVVIGGSNLSFSTNDKEFTFAGESLARLSNDNSWAHIAVVNNSPTSGFFYVDGQKVIINTTFSAGNILTNDFNGYLDEVRVYDKSLTDAEIRYLAGRNFIDLSGNKLHAVAVGTKFKMDNPASDPGSSSDRPTVDENNNNRDLPRALGDSVRGEGNGRSVFIDDNNSYLDLSPHVSSFEGIIEGTIAFWVKPSGADDRTIFSASNTDENQTYFQIKLRGTAGALQLSAINDGVKVSEFYTNVNISTGTPTWRHVALVVNNTESTFWVDGQATGSVATPNGPGASRAFFSDIQGINFMAIGLHRDSNSSNPFNGNIDDFHIYDRPLTVEEINFLANQNQGRDQIPRLEALADAVGTIVITADGDGYKELPEAEFSYGLDGNNTSDLAGPTPPPNPNYGDLYYDNATKVVHSRYVGYAGDQNEGGRWRTYHRAYGTPELGGSSVDKILWTKDTFKTNRLKLPNDRNVSRRYVEYIVAGAGSFSSPSYSFGTPEGLFGYTAVPSLLIEKSITGLTKDDATGYVLFFLDQNKSAVIENPGHGVIDFSADVVDVVRISGKGFRPEQIYRVETTDANGLPSFLDVVGSTEERWFRNRNDPTLYYSETNWINNNSGYHGTANFTDAGEIEFGDSNEFIFNDWSHSVNSGEPRDVTVDFNQSLSHVVVENPGFGYSVPVQVQLIGGYPVGPELQQWYDENQTGLAGRPLPYRFEPAVVEVNATDANGSILSFNIVDQGFGYYLAPQVVITGGGGNGAEALATIDENGSITNVAISEDLDTGEKSFGRGYFNTEINNKPTVVAGSHPLDGLHPDFRDANASILLGGRLSRIALCPCGDHKHMDPFIEIWDRNRSEKDIDDQGKRARATAEVRNGVIEKIVVLDSGSGYVDQVVYVRGSPNNQDIPNTRSNYFSTVNGVRQRQWRCTNLRETVDGLIKECGHIQMGLYPPERCPGDDVDNPIVVAGYDNSDHVNKTFRTTKCFGTKVNYVLMNDPYRFPYERWQPWDAKLVALNEGGKIKEIIVVDGGDMYGSTQVAVSGSGGDVDVITAYDDEGVNTHVIFDDPSLKNLETDIIPRPLGAGQGLYRKTLVLGPFTQSHFRS